MYRKILLPIQFASEVEPMVHFAADLLDADGEIRVLHVIPSTTLPEVTRQWRSSINFVIPAHESGAALDVMVESEVRASTDVSGEILESAETHNVDAILMTIGGDRRSRNPFVGHTATGLLHHAPSDVLIINRLALAASKIPRILVPSFRPVPPPKVMALAEEIGLRHPGVPVVTLHLGPRGELPPGAASSLDEQTPRGVPIVRRHALFSEARFGRRRLAETILEAAARERFGLLLVGDEGDPRSGTLLTRRFVEELFRGAPCPVLTLRT